ncbi:isochorismatase family cysteine hydrolase [Rhodopseudomonas sp. B29]|uniref:isochorismatase family cysteine hydrolase n=1 Tax=Rhodopseudomonas sp. B29 TaxID=95607 RepID=UPI00034C071A|nr:isochorismatase family cysteine hydrolase [Rhodopseudomonas sp. B29]
MPLTTLDPMSALLVVDLQKGIVGAPVKEPMRPILERARALLDAFRAYRLPVVLINVVGTPPGRTEQPRRLTGELPAGFADFAAELDQQPDDVVITKRSWGVFAGTDLDARLKAAGVTQVVVIGVATGTGVEATARQAYERGYNVTLAIDAMFDPRTEAHAYSIANVFPRLGETGSSAAVIDHLQRRSA